MYKREEAKEQIYVLRSADKTITKIGRSYNPDHRTDSICISERKRYYLVYQSIPLLREEAKALEREIIKHFKEDCIKGNEWVSTHPTEVINFIIDKIGKSKKDDIYLEDLAEHHCFLSTNGKYSSISFEYIDGIRLDKDYYAYVRTIYNGQYITLGFINIGDAKRFLRKNKHLQEVVPIITELLYDKTYEEWRGENLILGHYANWSLI